MQRAVIDAGDRLTEPALELLDASWPRSSRGSSHPWRAHRRMSSLAADAPCPSWCRSGARCVRRSEVCARPIVDRDTVLLAAAAQRLGMELLAVIEMQPGHQARAPATRPRSCVRRTTAPWASTACAMHSATLVADGGSSDRWKPTTQRECTSIASVSHGRWIGARVRLSTTMTSTSV